MGKKGKSTPAATPTPQVETPDVDVAQLAAKKALDAREGAVNSVKAEEEENKQPTSMLAASARPAQQQRPRKRSVDPATSMASMAGGMNSAALITG